MEPAPKAHAMYCSRTNPRRRDINTAVIKSTVAEKALCSWPGRSRRRYLPKPARCGLGVGTVSVILGDSTWNDRRGWCEGWFGMKLAWLSYFGVDVLCRFLGFKFLLLSSSFAFANSRKAF